MLPKNGSWGRVLGLGIEHISYIDYYTAVAF